MSDYLLNHPVRNLLQRVRDYKKRSKSIQLKLIKRPDEWGVYQSDFNQEVNGIFRDIMIYSRVMEEANRADLTERLKKFFVEKLRKYFLYGEYINHSLAKPRGYAGDYLIIDAIYKNNPQTNGYERLFDNYFQMSPISIAVRNRKEDFKRIIKSIVANCAEPIRILNLASGPCRDLSELLGDPEMADKFVLIDCIEQDVEAIKYAKKLIDNSDQVRFINMNVARLALYKNVQDKFEHKYDLIYSTGLFDYLDYRLSTRLISNCKKLLTNNGVIAISDVRDRFTNPSIHFMEWVGDWNLIYRDEKTFKKIFIDAGFQNQELTSLFEQQGMFHYVIAQNLVKNSDKKKLSNNGFSQFNQQKRIIKPLFKASNHHQNYSC